MSLLTPDVFTLDYRGDQHLLVARWLQPVDLPAIKASYEAIMQLAQAQHNCRHWLLDMRRRTLGDPAGLEWFGREFSPQLVAKLGGPVFVAYFAMIDQAVARTHEGIGPSIAEGELGGAHYHYFNREDEALAWLAKQP